MFDLDGGHRRLNLHKPGLNSWYLPAYFQILARRPTMRLALLLAALAACPAPGPSRSPKAASVDPMAARIDAVTAPYVTSNNYTGVIRFGRHGTLLVERAYGMASYEHNVANTANTRFHVASITKGFTAAAVFLLAERGKLSLTDPITKIFPDYPQGDTI